MIQKNRPTKKICKGDKVVAIAGNYRGQNGTVLRCIGDKAVVQGLNVRKKHVKKSQENPNGGILELEMPIHISNLQACDNEGKPVKLRKRISAEGHKELYYTEGDKEIVYRSLKNKK